MENFTQKAQNLLASAHLAAEGASHPELRIAHILEHMLKEEMVQTLLRESGVRIHTIEEKVKDDLSKQSKILSTNYQMGTSSEVNKLIHLTQNLAKARKDQFITVEMLLLAITELAPWTQVFLDARLNKNTLYKGLIP